MTCLWHVSKDSVLDSWRQIDTFQSSVGKIKKKIEGTRKFQNSLLRNNDMVNIFIS